MCYSGTTYCGEGIGFDLLLSTSVQKANFAPFTPGLKAGAPYTYTCRDAPKGSDISLQ
jgi:hypothetical protein